MGATQIKQICMKTKEIRCKSKWKTAGLCCQFTFCFKNKSQEEELKKTLTAVQA